jgi:integrase
MKTKINLQAVKSAVRSKARYVLWDTEVRGFGLRVNSDGSKTYVLKYVMGDRQKWFSIGRHGSPWTPEQARGHAIKLLGRIEEGVDPSGIKKADRASSMLVEGLCVDYLMAVEGGQIISRRGTTKKPSTLATDRGRIERHIKPLLGTKRVKDITASDIARFRDAVAAGQTAADTKTKSRGRAIVKGGRGTATRTLGLLGAIFSYAVSQGLRPDNPARGVQRFKDRSCERYLSSSEMKRLGDACTAAERAWHEFEAAHSEWQISGRHGLAPCWPDNAENPIAIAAIRFLLLTGMRKSEVLNLRREWVDFDRCIIRLPDSKSGKKAVPVGQAAIDVLLSISPLAGNPHVFYGAKRERPFVGLPKVWTRIRAKAGLTGTRLHDLRHTFASHGASGGASLYILAKIMGHADSKTTARYAHLSDDPLKAGVEKISQNIAALIAP